MISFVVAYSNNRVIGKGNDLPWHLPEDLRRFKQITTGHAVIMGKNTYESIFGRLGKALPERQNIVVSRSLQTAPPGFDLAGSLNDAIRAAKDKQIYIIGGEQIFKAALDDGIVDRIYATEIDATIEGDKFFPPIDSKEWRVVKSENHESSGYKYKYVLYERRNH